VNNIIGDELLLDEEAAAADEVSVVCNLEAKVTHITDEELQSNIDVPAEQIADARSDELMTDDSISDRPRTDDIVEMRGTESDDVTDVEHNMAELAYAAQQER
jgi:hypothetical protein